MGSVPLGILSERLFLALDFGTKTLKGRAELLVQVAPGQRAVGLNAFHLDIHRVTVDGHAAEWTQKRYKWEALPDSLLKVRPKELAAAVQMVAEETRNEYADFLRDELAPELRVALPGAVLEEAQRPNALALRPAAREPSDVQMPATTPQTAPEPSTQPCPVASGGDEKKGAAAGVVKMEEGEGKDAAMDVDEAAAAAADGKVRPGDGSSPLTQLEEAKPASPRREGLAAATNHAEQKPPQAADDADAGAMEVEPEVLPEASTVSQRVEAAATPEEREPAAQPASAAAAAEMKAEAELQHGEDSAAATKEGGPEEAGTAVKAEWKASAAAEDAAPALQPADGAAAASEQFGTAVQAEEVASAALEKADPAQEAADGAAAAAEEEAPRDAALRLEASRGQGGSNGMQADSVAETAAGEAGGSGRKEGPPASPEAGTGGAEGGGKAATEASHATPGQAAAAAAGDEGLGKPEGAVPRTDAPEGAGTEQGTGGERGEQRAEEASEQAEARRVAPEAAAMGGAEEEPPGADSKADAVANADAGAKAARPSECAAVEKQSQGVSAETRPEAAPAAAGGEGPRLLKVVVEYSVTKAECGLRFWGRYAATQNTLRRSRSWMPCLDQTMMASAWELAVQVPSDLVVVGPGKLEQVYAAAAGAAERVWVFRTEGLMLAASIGFAAGPFAIVQGGMGTGRKVGRGASKELGSGCRLTHFGPPALLAELEHSVKTFQLPFRLFEAEMGRTFPIASFQQVFLPAEMVQTGLQSVCALSLVSSDHLAQPRSVEDTIEARLLQVRALARQWFGVLVVPKEPSDCWLVEGLAGYLESLYVRRFMGLNEATWRVSQQARAVQLADDGMAPPLCSKSTVDGWTPALGTEMLQGKELFCWKAIAVIDTLERRVGEENFKKVVEKVVGNAVVALLRSRSSPATQSDARPALEGPVAGEGMPGAADHMSGRALGTSQFLAELGRHSSHNRREVMGVAERWVYSAGCPRLECAIQFLRRRNHLGIAIRQTGPAAAKAGLLRALRAKDAGAGSIKVRIAEVGEVEKDLKTLHLGCHAVTYKEIPMQSRVVNKRTKRRPGHLDPDPDAGGDSAQTAAPVQWVHLDPGGEWLGEVLVMNQPSWMWSRMLESQNDIRAQIAAVRGLTLQGAMAGTTSILSACLNNSQVYCRVRIEAAVAMGQTTSANDNYAGLFALIQFYRDRCFDTTRGHYKPHAFLHLAEHLVNQAIPIAVSQVRDKQGCTPEEALDFLLALVRDNENLHNPFLADNFTASLLSALGSCRPRSRVALQRVLQLLDTSLTREAVLPSPRRVVGRSALRSLTRLATSLLGPPTGAKSGKDKDKDDKQAAPGSSSAAARTVASGVMKLLRSYADGREGHPREMRVEATLGMMEVQATLDRDIRPLLRLGLRLVLQEPHVPSQQSLLDSLYRLVSGKVTAEELLQQRKQGRKGHRAPAGAASSAAADAAGGDAGATGMPGAPADGKPWSRWPLEPLVGMEELAQVQLLMGFHHLPGLRHTAFLLMQRLAQQPPLLHWEHLFMDAHESTLPTTGVPASSGMPAADGRKTSAPARPERTQAAPSGAVTADSGQVGSAGGTKRVLKLRLGTRSAAAGGGAGGSMATRGPGSVEPSTRSGRTAAAGPGAALTSEAAGGGADVDTAATSAPVSKPAPSSDPTTAAPSSSGRVPEASAARRLPSDATATAATVTEGGETLDATLSKPAASHGDAAAPQGLARTATVTGPLASDGQTKRSPPRAADKAAAPPAATASAVTGKAKKEKKEKKHKKEKKEKHKEKRRSKDKAASRPPLPPQGVLAAPATHQPDPQPPHAAAETAAPMRKQPEPAPPAAAADAPELPAPSPMPLPASAAAPEAPSLEPAPPPAAATVPEPPASSSSLAPAAGAAAALGASTPALDPPEALAAGQGAPTRSPPPPPPPPPPGGDAVPSGGEPASPLPAAAGSKRAAPWPARPPEPQRPSKQAKVAAGEHQQRLPTPFSDEAALAIPAPPTLQKREKGALVFRATASATKPAAAKGTVAAAGSSMAASAAAVAAAAMMASSADSGHRSKAEPAGRTGRDAAPGTAGPGPRPERNAAAAGAASPNAPGQPPTASSAAAAAPKPPPAALKLPKLKLKMPAAARAKPAPAADASAAHGGGRSPAAAAPSVPPQQQAQEGATSAAAGSGAPVRSVKISLKGLRLGSKDAPATAGPAAGLAAAPAAGGGPSPIPVGVPTVDADSSRRRSSSSGSKGKAAGEKGEHGGEKKKDKVKKDKSKKEGKKESKKRKREAAEQLLLPSSGAAAPAAGSTEGRPDGTA